MPTRRLSACRRPCVPAEFLRVLGRVPVTRDQASTVGRSHTRSWRRRLPSHHRTTRGWTALDQGPMANSPCSR